MKRLILALTVSFCLVPSQLPASAVSAVSPVGSEVAVATPVDELIALLTPIMELAAEIEKVGEDNVSLEQMGKFLELYGKLQDLQKKHGSYVLTNTDRDHLANWSKKVITSMGETLTAEEFAELRAELNQYKTLNDLIADMDLDNML